MNDILRGLGGNDTLRGAGGNDTLQGRVGNDTLDGGTGTDTASYSASLTGVIASVATNTATGEGSDTFLGVENLLGSSKVDTLTGSATNNKLTGGGGNDTERGGSGNDQVIGSGGADFLYGQDGDDTVNSKDGVSGNDTLSGGLVHIQNRCRERRYSGRHETSDRRPFTVGHRKRAAANRARFI